MSSIVKTAMGLDVSEKVSEIDKFDIFADSPKSSKGAKFHTELTCTDDFGNTLWKDHNELLLAGGLFTLSKLANVNAPLNIKTVNTDLNVVASETDPGYTGPRREDAIFGFAIGIGGCTDVFDTVSPVKYNERQIDVMIPFRKVPKDLGLSPEEQRRYFMKKEVGNHYEYYIKTFESEPIIKVEYDDPANGPVPNNPEAVSGDKIINTYLEFKLRVSEKDVREYFKINGAGLRKARINTLGLVHGYKDNNAGEYKGVKVFSKITFNNEALDNETKALIITYKIFI